MPARVRCAGRGFEHVRTFKHDFFAATGLYRDAASGELAVLKLNRRADAFTIPLGWIGRLLASREHHFYAALQDLPSVPRLIGRVGPHGLLHAYVPGRPLGRDDQVNDAFFDQLADALAEIHRRGMAYVDLNKRQNILLGDDGRAYLIDFQISLHLPPSRWGRLPGLRWALGRFQQADRYHMLKHKRRLRPDLLSDAERSVLERLSIWIRLHRAIARPLTRVRRRALQRLARSEQVEVAGSGAK